jgi:CDP-glycerol glycerophosphotransferase
MPAAPEVSVVVITYNDAKNLPRAVESVLRQSLRNVEVVISDDHSTDDTPRVAQVLATQDPRVRYTRLAANSGGCGVPRNEGLRHTRAPFVMFLDSDDELERHACYNLLRMAVEEGCDVASGLCRRYHVESDSWTSWYKDLYQERRVIEDMEDEPRFLFDSISTNKLYRRSFLDQHRLAFPERVKYEDLQFTARLYALVGRFGVIPETVYHWRIYHEDERRTITHQRSTPTNLADRLHAIRVARAILEAEDKPVLLESLTRKLLAHDARLAVEDLAETRDETLRGALADLLEPELRTVPREMFRQRRPMDRAALGMALLRNWPGVKQAVLSRRSGGALAGRVVPVGERLLWAPDTAWQPPPAGSLEEFLTDFTGEPILETPTPALRLAHVITALEKLPKGARLLGTTHDTLLKFTGDGAVPQLAMLIRLQRGRNPQHLPMRVLTAEPGRITWAVDVTKFTERNNQHETRWWITVRTTGGGRVNDSFACLDPDLGKVSFPEPTGATRHIRGRIRLYSTSNGDAAFKRARFPGRGAKPAQLLHLADRFGQELRKEARKREARLRVRAYELARRRPVIDNLVLFDSHMGKQFSDNPRAVYEELRRRGSDLEPVWDFIDPDAHPQVPGRVIRRHTFAYSEVVARARFIVDNQGLPAWIRKRPDQYHLQTWHGTPLKRMALHKLEHEYPLAETVARITGEAAWDALVSPSDYFERTFVDSYRYTGTLLRGGTPRNDVLVTHPQPDAALLRRLDLPPDRKVVLYAPTFREDVKNARRAAPVLLDVERWIEELGDTHYLLLRPHYLNRFEILPQHAPYLMDVSHVDEVSDLYRVADLLVTDYSSVMFDYAWLDRPIVIYAPDYESYTQDTRGTYFDLREDPPGPFSETQDELHDLVRTADDDAEERLRVLKAFRDRYCGVEDGKAAARVVDHLLGLHRRSR